MVGVEKYVDSAKVGRDAGVITVVVMHDAFAFCAFLNGVLYCIVIFE